MPRGGEIDLERWATPLWVALERCWASIAALQRKSGDKPMQPLSQPVISTH
jgi:hypothetical protein